MYSKFGMDCPLSKICNDWTDNNGDGFVDHATILDCPAILTGFPEICGDYLDNDGGRTVDRWDFGDCQDCSGYGTCPPGPSPGDRSHLGFQGPQPRPAGLIWPSEQCFNGWDDDGDGFIDYGCPNPPPIYPSEKCWNRYDDDWDGKIDEPPCSG